MSKCCREEACSLAEEGQFDAAIKVYRMHLHSQPQDCIALEELAQCLAEAGNDAKALVAIEKALQIGPQNFMAWWTKARIALNSGDLRCAMASFQKTISLCHEDATRAEILIEFREAECFWQQSIALRIGIPQLQISNHLEDETLGPGQLVWESGLCAAEYLSRHYSGERSGKSLLELGCGTGIVGISAALLGFSPVLITDVEAMRPLAEENIGKCSLPSTSLAFAELDWTRPDTFQASYSSNWDIIVLADVLHVEAHVPHLMKVLEIVIARNSRCKVLLAHPDRSETITKHFMTAMADIGRKPRLVARSSLDNRVKVYLFDSVHDTNCACCH